MKPIEPAAIKYGVVKESPDGSRVICPAAFKTMVAEYTLHQFEAGTQFNDDQTTQMQGNVYLKCLALCGITLEDLLHANESKLNPQAFVQPPLPYKDANEFIAKVKQKHKNQALTCIESVCEILSQKNFKPQRHTVSPTHQENLNRPRQSFFAGLPKQQLSSRRQTMPNIELDCDSDGCQDELTNFLADVCSEDWKRKRLFKIIERGNSGESVPEHPQPYFKGGRKYIEDLNKKKVDKQIHSFLTHLGQKLDKSTIQQVLGEVVKNKQPREKSVIGTAFKSGLAELELKFKRALLAQDDPAIICCRSDGDLQQMAEEVQQNIFDQAPSAESLQDSEQPTPQESKISYHAGVLRRKDEIDQRLKAFNRHHTTMPGFGQSRENWLKAKFKRLEAPSLSKNSSEILRCDGEFDHRVNKITEQMHQVDYRKLLQDIGQEKRKESEASMPDLKVQRKPQTKFNELAFVTFLNREQQRRQTQNEEINSSLLVRQCQLQQKAIQETTQVKHLTEDTPPFSPLISTLGTNSIALSPMERYGNSVPGKNLKKLNSQQNTNQSQVTLLAAHREESSQESASEINHKQSSVNVTNLSLGLCNQPSSNYKLTSILPAKISAASSQKLLPLHEEVLSINVSKIMPIYTVDSQTSAEVSKRSAEVSVQENTLHSYHVASESTVNSRNVKSIDQVKELSTLNLLDCSCLNSSQEQLDYAAHPLRSTFNKKQQKSPKKKIDSVSRRYSRVFEPNLPTIRENESPELKVDMETQVAYPTLAFSSLNDIDLNQPRKTFKSLSQRRPTHQEASHIYFMAKEDVIRQSLATNKGARQVKAAIEQSPKASPRPILSKLGGGFLNKNSIASVIELSGMFLAATSASALVQTDSGLRKSETTTIVEESTSQVTRNSPLKPQLKPLDQQLVSGFPTPSGSPLDSTIYSTKPQHKVQAPREQKIATGFEGVPSNLLLETNKLPVVLRDHCYKKMVRERHVFQDFQFVQLTDEPLSRIKGIKKQKVAPENRLELTAVSLQLFASR